MFETVIFVKIFLAPEILTPTELGSVGAPQHHCLQSSNKLLHFHCAIEWRAESISKFRQRFACRRPLKLGWYIYGRQ